MKKIKLSYIGGGSRSWARRLMVDLARETEFGGTVYLYDIDFSAAKDNEVIGNLLKNENGLEDNFEYKAVKTIGEALDGADFVVISILPATFNEMASDIHTPEKYGIYQSVGDTTGPGGIVRTLRTVPMIKEIALAVKKYCPKAWVINYTNPMSASVKTLYKAFPEIKAFGCCHEVFATQKLLWRMSGKEGDWHRVKTNVVGINHFTWLTSATLDGEDLYPLYREMVENNYEQGVKEIEFDWETSVFGCCNRVKFDLFSRYGVIAAAGDRHLAEFCPGDWYLHDPETVKQWKFRLTPALFRFEDAAQKLAETKRIVDGTQKFKLFETGEEGVRQIRSLLGFGDFTTNVNMPNRGQAEMLPLGAVVETNIKFSKDNVQPVYGGTLPKPVVQLLHRACLGEEITVDGAYNGDYEAVFSAFIDDALVKLKISDARKLFDEMLFNTREYLPYYNEYLKRKKKI